MALFGPAHRRRVLFLPGYGAGDRSTVALRTSISAHGHHVHRWKMGRNAGPTPEIMKGLEARLVELADRHDRKLTLVGWSLGGVYAWALAARFPHQIEQVISLGSPLHSLPQGVPALSVPATSIWSRHDRIVPWSSSVVSGARTENIEVRATHLTLGVDPLVIHAIADRLGQHPDRWRPFRPPRWLPFAYPDEQVSDT
jgi:pimeloyl-ACP methyl ester carboxylesterase